MPTDYRRFVTQCQRTLKALGIDGLWDVRFMDCTKAEVQPHVADTQADAQASLVTLSFHGLGDSGCTPERVARHEIAHVLLAHLAALAVDRYATEENLTQAEEQICIILEKVLP